MILKNHFISVKFNEIDELERQIGTLAFRKIFLSIMADNGGEFSDAAKLERSVLNKQS